MQCIVIRLVRLLIHLQRYDVTPTATQCPRSKLYRNFGIDSMTAYCIILYAAGRYLFI